MPHDVIVVLGSKTDLEKVERSKMLTVFAEVGVSWELSVISAHRNPTVLVNYVSDREHEGAKVFIGIAGMSAALPGMLASLTDGRKPVLGVALSSSVFDGLDALLAQVRMPPGRPVAVCGIDDAGLENAALAACQILALSNAQLRRQLSAFQETTNKEPALGLLASDKKLGE